MFLFCSTFLWKCIFSSFLFFLKIFSFCFCFKDNIHWLQNSRTFFALNTSNIYHHLAPYFFCNIMYQAKFATIKVICFFMFAAFMIFSLPLTSRNLTDVVLVFLFLSCLRFTEILGSEVWYLLSNKNAPSHYLFIFICFWSIFVFSPLRTQVVREMLSACKIKLLFPFCYLNFCIPIFQFGYLALIIIF